MKFYKTKNTGPEGSLRSRGFASLPIRRHSKSATKNWLQFFNLRHHRGLRATDAMKKYSLHLGLNRVDPDRYGGWPGFLNACENDATGLCVALTKLGYTARALLNEQVTLAALRGEIVQLAAIAEAGDEVVISDSGHGGQQGCFSELDGYNETLCLFDGQMVDDEFVELLSLFKPGVNVIVILDSCHSGGMDRGAFKPAIRAAPKSTWLPPRKMPMFRRGKIAASAAIFAACREQETAADGDKFGAWTGSLLSALSSQPSTFQEWFDRAYDLCPHEQHPVLRPLGEIGVLETEIA